MNDEIHRRCVISAKSNDVFKGKEYVDRKGEKVIGTINHDFGVSNGISLSKYIKTNLIKFSDDCNATKRCTGMIEWIGNYPDESMSTALGNAEKNNYVKKKKSNVVENLSVTKMLETEVKSDDNISEEEIINCSKPKEKTVEKFLKALSVIYRNSSENYVTRKKIDEFSVEDKETGEVIWKSYLKEYPVDSGFITYLVRFGYLLKEGKKYMYAYKTAPVREDAHKIALEINKAKYISSKKVEEQNALKTKEQNTLKRGEYQVEATTPDAQDILNKLNEISQELVGTKQELVGTKQELVETKQLLVDANQKLTDANQKLTDANQRLTNVEKKSDEVKSIVSAMVNTANITITAAVDNVKAALEDKKK
jgi:hypothetical protein